MEAGISLSILSRQSLNLMWPFCLLNGGYLETNYAMMGRFPATSVTPPFPALANLSTTSAKSISGWMKASMKTKAKTNRMQLTLSTGHAYASALWPGEARR